MIGRTISHYRIVDHLGGGGMGVVFSAHDTRLGRDVALKFLPDELARDPEALTRFAREARAAASLNHPHICTVYDIGEHDGRPFIAMERLEGQTLKHLIEGRALSTDRVIELGLQIADALAAAHAKGLVHRDVKPANIFVTTDGRVKVLDFGLARLLPEDRAHADTELVDHGLTQAGEVLGTVAYMAPEQALGQPVDARADVFSLGVVLYEMATGVQPFVAPTAYATMDQVLHTEPAALEELNPRHPPLLAATVSKALEKAPALRYQDVAELRADLERLRGETSGAGAAGTSVAARSTPLRGSRHRWTRVALPAAVAIMVVSGMLWWPFREAAAPSARSIAVLPFANLSGDPDNEYFSDGITEDILNHLSRVSDLRVISRTSVMRYKHTELALRDIGAELGAATILEGSVRRDRDRVRINAQLIDAATDQHLWAEGYDREVTDVFAIQSEIAQHIAAALDARLTTDESRRLAAVPTRNLTAYDVYLQGRDSYHRYTQEGNAVALERFQRAVELDPDFALAYAGVADAHMIDVQRWGQSRDRLALAMEAAERAVALDPELAEGHKALGSVLAVMGRYSQAQEPLERAIALNPGSFPAINNLGAVKGNMGAVDEAIRLFRRALPLGPVVRPTALQNIAYELMMLGDLAGASETLDEVLAFQPDYEFADRNRSQIALLEGRYDDAVAIALRMVQDRPSSVTAYLALGDARLFQRDHSGARTALERAYELVPTSEIWHRRVAVLLGYALWTTGEPERAEELFDAYGVRADNEMASGSEAWQPRLNLAAVQAIRGNRTQAVHWLREAMAFGWTGYLLVVRDPLFGNLRDDPEFQEIIATQRTRVEELRRRVER